MFAYRFAIDDLPNGLRLITVPTPFPDTVAFYVVVATGSRHEVEAGKSGFAHFFEHMMFRGTKTRSAAEQTAWFKRIGAARNAYTEDDYTVYHATFDKQDLEGVLDWEADRFQNLEYSQKDFRTEAMAVFGEYNKNFANPGNRLDEVLRDTAFTRHTYKHTTMGFLPDIVAMPRQFEYSKSFFARFYKPENTTLLVVGDVQPENVKPLVEKYWGGWARGAVAAEIPAEPPQTEARTAHVTWEQPTQPYVVVAFKGPAIDVQQKDMPALDVIARLWFGRSSELHQRLYVQEQKVDYLGTSFPDMKDPFLLQIAARVRDIKDVAYVRDQILQTCERAKTEPVAQARLEEIQHNLRYAFVGSLDSADAIAGALAGYIGRHRTPAAINALYRHYAQLTSDDLRTYSARYFQANARTIVTLAKEPIPEPQLELPNALLQPGNTPLVTFRLLFRSGALLDPADRPGLTNLLANYLTSSSTRRRSYEQIVKELYPMAAAVQAQVDREMTVFSGTVHRDNLERYWELMREMLLEPAWKPEDLARVRADLVAFLDDQLRRGNDEELGKEVLQSLLLAGTPTRHLVAGTLASLQAITLDELQQHHARLLTHAALTVGLAGGFTPEFAARVRKDLAHLPAGAPPPAPAARADTRPAGNSLTIVQKKTPATGIHIGFPIEVTRGHPDWVALWLVRSWFGEHRSENSFLYQRLREIRGLNYGDYAYIEYFPRGMYQFAPDPNLVRKQQNFEIWIRPVPPEHGPFALRAAWYELDKLVRNGLTQEAFATTRAFLHKNAPLLLQTQDQRLGSALDAAHCGTGEFVSYVRDGLAKLSLEAVNAAIRKHLRSDHLTFVVVTEDAQGFVDAWLQHKPASIRYQAQPPADVLAEDQVIGGVRIPLAKERVRIVPVDEVFQR